MYVDICLFIYGIRYFIIYVIVYINIYRSMRKKRFIGKR